MPPQPADTTPRYDEKTAQEAIALAARLQDEHRETMTVAQVEAIAAEVGVEAQFVRAALAKVEAKRTEPETTGDKVEDFFLARDKRLAERRRRVRATLRSFPAGLWWALGWLLPAITAILTERSGAGDTWVPLMGLLYVGIGILLSIMNSIRHSETAVTNQAQVAQSTGLQNDVSREQLLETLFAVQQRLASDETTRAFLSVDVVASSEMKQAASELASEYSFGQYRRWVEDRVRAQGGQIHSAAGDGIMCVFDSEAQAIETANRLLDDLPRFNREQNRLAQPFRIRCGVNAGVVAAPADAPLGNWQSAVIDQAAVLQKQAAPNTVAVGTGG